MYLMFNSKTSQGTQATLAFKVQKDENMSTTCGCQCSAVRCLESLNRKRIALWIVNTHSEFQVNIFSNNRDITKCQFLHADNTAAKAIAISQVFSKNNRVNKMKF